MLFFKTIKSAKTRDSKKIIGLWKGNYSNSNISRILGHLESSIARMLLKKKEK